jgi:hypothetical protein
MLNGLNILPSYLDYFNLDDVTTGLNTASVFIGGTLGPLVAGVIADRLGRRPAIFWGSAVTLIGIIIQTAAQNIAMFVVGRIILGFASQVSGVAAGVYLSETFASRYRAWGMVPYHSASTFHFTLTYRTRRRGSLERLLLRRSPTSCWNYIRDRLLGLNLGLESSLAVPRDLFDSLHPDLALRT